MPCLDDFTCLNFADNWWLVDYLFLIVYNVFLGFTMYATCVIWLAFIVVFIANPNYVSLKVN